MAEWDPIGTVRKGVGRCYLAEYFGDVEGAPDSSRCEAFTRIDHARAWIANAWAQELGTPLRWRYDNLAGRWIAERTVAA